MKRKSAIVLAMLVGMLAGCLSGCSEQTAARAQKIETTAKEIAKISTGVAQGVDAILDAVQPGTSGTSTWDKATALITKGDGVIQNIHVVIPITPKTLPVPVPMTDGTAPAKP